MAERRRVENVFSLFARGAKTSEDPPLLYYRLGDEMAVVVMLPPKLTFRPGGRPRYAHGLGRTTLEEIVSVLGPIDGFVRLDCSDWAGAASGETWWFREDPTHPRQINHTEVDR